MSAATPPYARPRKNKKQLRESDASQPPGHSGGVQQGSVGNPATRQTARNAKQSQLASEPPTRHALPSATQNSCKVYNSAKEDAPATLTRPASSAGHTTKKGKRTRGTATHLGAHHHPEELSLAHRTIRSACDLVAQLQLVIRQNKVVHQKAEKTRRARSQLNLPSTPPNLFAGAKWLWGGFLRSLSRTHRWLD